MEECWYKSFGGADSACLAYTIAKYIKENNINCKIHAINFLRCYPTRSWQKHVGLRVYNNLKAKCFDIVIARYYPNIPEIEHSQIGHSILSRWISNNQVIMLLQVVIIDFVQVSII